jgi:hypothetical protein
MRLWMAPDERQTAAQALGQICLTHINLNQLPDVLRRTNA